MSFLEISISGGMFILAVAALRAVLIQRLPKRTFSLLWKIALLRLLIPVTVTSVFSVYPLLLREKPFSAAVMEKIEASVGKPAGSDAASALPSGVPEPERIIDSQDPEQPDVAWRVVSPQTTGDKEASYRKTADKQMVSQAEENRTDKRTWSSLLWGTGAAVMAAWFLTTYLRFLREFRTSLPVSDAFTLQWLRGHPLKRKLSIRYSDRISSPLTYGIFRPVILLPKRLDRSNQEQLSYVLLHEYIHVRRFDAAFKLLFALALCIHWFNPMAWLMYYLYSRDAELACDERVVRLSADAPSYARILIQMEAQKSGLTPFCGFNENSMKERITAIMKMKSFTLPALLAAAGIILAVTVSFATSSADAAERSMADSPSGQPEATEDADLEDGESSDFSVTEDPQITEEIQEQIRAQYEEELAPYRPLGLSWQYTPDANGGELQMYFEGKEVRGIYDHETGTWISAHSGNSSYSSDAIDLYVVYDSDNAQSRRSPSGLRMATEEESAFWTQLRNTSLPESEAEEDSSVQDSRRTAPGTRADYQSLLALKTPGYETETLSEFNDSLLEWASEDSMRMERIDEDIASETYRPFLSEEEQKFRDLTIRLSARENEARIQGKQTGILQRPRYWEFFPNAGFIDWKHLEAGFCELYYEFSYEIPDPAALTVGERDRLVGDMLYYIHNFWNRTDMKELIRMTEEEIHARLEEIAEAHSSDLLTITIEKTAVRTAEMNEGALASD